MRYIIAFVFVGLIGSYALYKQTKESRSIEKHKKVTTGKINRIQLTKSGEDLVFYDYKIQDKIYDGIDAMNVFEAGHYKVDSCYLVIYSSENPEYSRLTKQMVSTRFWYW